MARADIHYEFEETPGPGKAQSIADGIHWLRMPLPFALDHINLWLVRDEGGWVSVDTGLGDDASLAHWRDHFDSTMAGDPLTRVIVTHLHPDHVGCAGFLARHFGAPLWMTREEYLLCRVLVADTGNPAPQEGVAFYRGAGYSETQLDQYRQRFGLFGRFVTPLPPSYFRLADRFRFAMGNVEWEVVVGRGHSPEHACLFDPERNVVLGGDQLLPAISANVSVHPTEPTANPLADWLATLADIRRRLPADVLVLPAHGRPYRGVHERIDQLIDEHQRRLSDVLEVLASPRRAVDLFPALYRREITDDNLMFATGEAIAHLNYLRATSEIVAETDSAGITWYRRQ